MPSWFTGWIAICIAAGSVGNKGWLTLLFKSFPQVQTNLLTPHWSLTNLPPLIPLEFLAVARREKMSTLLRACDGSVFKHVWDIGVHSKATPRRELRVFYVDVDAVLTNKPIPTLKHEECTKHFIPETRGLRGTELQTLWTCGPDLIHDLEAAGHLAVERDRLAATGPRASKLYARASIIAFLHSRFIGDCRKN